MLKLLSVFVCLYIYVYFRNSSLYHLRNFLDGKKCIFELEFSDVNLDFESRPRYSSSQLHVALGALCLKDMFTTDTIFKNLISPNKWVSKHFVLLSSECNVPQLH